MLFPNPMRAHHTSSRHSVRSASLRWLRMLMVAVIVFAAGLGTEAQPVNLPSFWKSRLFDIEAAVRAVKKGQVSVLAKSAGGRNIYLVAYGEKQNWHSTANYNSAAAGTDPASYARK